MAVNMQENKVARFGTVCALYFAQGVPWFFVATVLVTFLVDNNSMSDDQKLTLISAGMLPWIIGKLVLGPVIDRYRFPRMGRRRPWVLLAQLGMILTMAAFLLVEDPADDLQMLALFFLIHNIFAALQDVSSDALAVDTLSDEELPLANGLMFVAKGFGAMFAVLGLSRVLSDSGFHAALQVQIGVLAVVMLIPLFVRERPGDQLFPWSDSTEGSASGADEDTMTFGEIITGFTTAVSDNAAKTALLLCTIMWIGGGMGTGMGIIDFQWEFLFVDELGWESQDYLDAKGLPVFLMTMLGFLVGGLLLKVRLKENPHLRRGNWYRHDGGMVHDAVSMDGQWPYVANLVGLDAGLGHRRGQLVGLLDVGHDKGICRHAVFNLHDAHQRRRLRR